MTFRNETTFLKRTTFGRSTRSGGAHATAKKAEPQHWLEARGFAVGEDSYCVWDWDLLQRNHEYLKGLDPHYFEYAARANFAQLDAEDAMERRRAAIAIRSAYHHGLESFFALLFAALQAPDCVVGWMQVYTPARLRDLVKALDPFLAGLGDDRDGARQRHETLRSHLKVRPLLTWAGVSETVNLVPGEDREHATRVRNEFAGLWRRFAKDFVNQNFTDEYNSIKHGLRVGAGGFDFAIGLQQSPDEPAPPEAMVSLGGSEHGSSFFMPRTFVERSPQEEKRPRLNGRNHQFLFRVRRHRLNWDPRGLCMALVLVSASINNVRAFILAINGHARPGLKFLTPAPEAFRLPMGRPEGIEATMMDAVVFEGDVESFDEGRIRQGIEQEAEAWTRRAHALGSRPGSRPSEGP